MKLAQPIPPLHTKICGITTAEDARIALSCHADALGFNFAPQSPRRLDFKEARSWIEKLQGKADRVAVVVNPTAEELKELRESGCFEWIQFHGDETPEFCENEGGPAWIRAIRVKDAHCLEEGLKYRTMYLLCDAWSDKAYGGTGTRLNWDMMHKFVHQTPERRIILAGGLTPHNVREAVRIVRPHAVDVASGVELEGRRKNEYLVREFIQAALTA